MIHILHTFIPKPIIMQMGPLSLRWYGLLIVLGISSALAVTYYLSTHFYKIKKDKLFDLVFWLIITGILGARIYDIFLYLPYYLEHPLQTIQIWKGGMAIHGSIIAGLLVIYFFARRHKINFFKLTALFTPGLALGQAIGRFGNYFNQEIFGLPSNLPWSIPISLAKRPEQYSNFTHFHPTFLYESLGSLIIFLILIGINIYRAKKNKLNAYFFAWSTALYMILYSMLRFLLEFIRLDEAPNLFGLRWPQIISLFLIFISILLITTYPHAKQKSQST